MKIFKILRIICGIIALILAAVIIYREKVLSIHPTIYELFLFILNSQVFYAEYSSKND